MLAVASLKRSLEFDPVEQGVKRKRAEIKRPSNSNFTVNSPAKQHEQIAPRPLTPSKSSSTVRSSSNDDTPMFSNIQTAQICARLLREQDEKLREQYDELLKSKLNEQYETFIRYSHDSVHKPSNKPILFNYNENAQDAKQQMDFSYIS